MLKKRLMAAGATIAVLFSVSALSGCHSGDADKNATPSQQEAKVGTQQRFIGTQPCADCAGIRTDLTLMYTEDGQPDGFTMNQTYQGASADDNHTFSFKGTFAVQTGTPDDSKAVVYHLTPDDKEEAATYYQRVDDNTLKMLDKDKKQIQSDQNYSLTRSAP